MKLILTILCFCIFNVAMAQNDNTRSDRESYQLVVLVDSEAAYVDSVKSGPFISGPNILQLYPGEKIFIEVEEKGNTITKFTPVKENRHPERTLEVSFMQKASGRVHETMMLKISNPFKQDLSYSAMIFLLKQNKWVRTTVVPVKAGLASYETWPDVIITLALGEWKFLNKYRSYAKSQMKFR